MIHICLNAFPQTIRKYTVCKNIDTAIKKTFKLLVRHGNRREENDFKSKYGLRNNCMKQITP